MVDVRSIRRGLGLSQADLATKLGVHQTTISRLETGDMPVDERTALALDALTLRHARRKPAPRPSEAA